LQKGPFRGAFLLPQFANIIGYLNVAAFVVDTADLQAILLCVKSYDNQKPGKYAC
jgi:hypothetical protein